MGISVVNYSEHDGGSDLWGILREGTIYPLKTLYLSHREVMTSYFSDREAFVGDVSEKTLSPSDVQFNSPISKDVQLFCQGLNYADHRAESGVADAPHEENLLFMKAASSICAPNETILRPKDCKLLDYEIELALVMKEGVSKSTPITDGNLSQYVGGIVLCNDVSARDIMFGSPVLQWFRGKSQPTFCPMGPVLYLMDEADFDKLYSLEMTLKLNGKVKQSASTNLLIHRPAPTLTDLSSFAGFSAGDCLLTGTPGGVLVNVNLKTGLSIILNFKNDVKRRKKFIEAQLAQTRFLEPGDVLELSLKTPDGSIDLGCQRNEIADA
ncbi:MAG: fumarylacetoacetate hydrolase family protein [Halioglobus sp.]